MSKKRIICWFLFILVFSCEAIAGYYIWHIKGYIFNDAISKVANAFYVLYIRPPHLAAIGSVWNPLPSLLELPFLLLWPIYKPIASSGLAGVVMNAAFMAGSAVLLYRYTIEYGRSHFTGIAIALLYCFNPFMFIYGFSGMSEAPFYFMLIWMIFSYTRWMENEESVYLVHMAIALALAFLIRYETIPIAGCLFLAVTLILFMVHRKNLASEQQVSIGYSFQRSEGKGIVLLTPLVYTCLIWILYNWIITGNPFYFLNSDYSNLANKQTFANIRILRSMVGEPVLILKYVFLCTKYFSIPLVVILFYRLIKSKLAQLDLLTLIILIISTFVMQLYMLYKGVSNGTFRYFSYPFVILCAWLPYEMKRNNSRLFTALCLVSLVIANVALGNAWFCTRELANVPMEIEDLRFVCQDREKTQIKVAQFINKHLPQASILMDSYRTYTIILNLNKPANIITSCSYEFQEALREPWKYKINYIIVPSATNDENQHDALNRLYPELYREGAPWCVLVKEFDGFYKLYRVNPKKPRKVAGLARL
jgi:hypothetical protein